MSAIKVAILINTLIFCNGFVLMSSVPSGSYGSFKLFINPLRYSIDSAVVVNDVISVAKDVGYKIKAELLLDPIWTNSENQFLLKFELKSPKLHIRPKLSFQGFTEHNSLLDTYRNSPFFASWKNGIIEHVYFDDKEDSSLIDFKKGLVSLFQFQILDVEQNETDVSGMCNVFYETMTSTTTRKIKKNCKTDLIPRNDEKVLSALTLSRRITKYDFTGDLTAIKSIFSEELHKVSVSMKQDVGNKARVWQELNLLEDNTVSNTLKATSWSDALQEVEAKYGYILKPQSLEVMVDKSKIEGGNSALAASIKENRDYLKSEHLGTEKSATIFISVLQAVRQAKSEEIVKALKGAKNKEILQQLCDIMGYAQTYEAHKAAKLFLNFDSEYDRDNIERYLWALSIGPNPDEKVILDVLKLSEDGKFPEHISETLLLTASAMAHRFSSVADEEGVSNVVKDTIAKNLSKCKESACQVKQLRALKNLKKPDTVDILIDYIKKGTKPVTVMALKALRSMDKSVWYPKVLNVCYNVFYQVDKKYDSSARTLALDIIFEAKTNPHKLRDLMLYLKSNDEEYEVKQLLMQWIQLISDKDSTFKGYVKTIFKLEKDINSWHVLAQKGISNAIHRTVSASEWANVSLVSVQEVSSGLLKRGHVDVLVDTPNGKKELFSLGLFASGLSSVVSSDSEAEEEAMSAGMELTVQGVQLRPFTFFSGQGELMGHVWSGTASERTPAFQALTLLQDQSHRLVLGNGAIGEWNLIGAVSFDLSAQIQISLWNRVAHSVIDENAGIAVQGAFKVTTPFVTSAAEFYVTLEPKLEIETDTDFYSKVSLCVQVKQPDTLFRHSVNRTESIPQYKQKLSRNKVKSVTIPGKTYALNQKNNEMCNVIHNK